MTSDFVTYLFQEAMAVFINKQEIVIGPTPPGTGLKAEATSLTSSATSPQSFLFSFL